MHPHTVRRVSIPIADPTAPETARATVVLVVTPDANLREVSTRVLAREGYRVLNAAHGGHAVLACLEAGHVDVLAVELSMEDVSGPALAERLRRHCPDLRTVYFAKSGTPECDGVIVRPFTRDDLLAVLPGVPAAAMA
jgi:CheY-like chemotaxis protein